MADLRDYARQTNFRLVVGFALILFLIGDGLIWWLYGQEAALLGLFCLLGGVGLLALIGLLLWLLDIVVKRNRAG